MCNFEKEKRDFLSKKDKSKKGSIDKEIKPLVDLINSLDNYYTTSSCSGRIILLVKSSNKKQDASWLFASHSRVRFAQIKDKLKRIPRYAVWFKQEPAIFHICCKTIEDAQKLINTARNVGLRKSGIQSTKRKIIVELVGSDLIETIIAKNNKLLINNNYLKILIKEANKKLTRNKEKVKRFYEKIKKFIFSSIALSQRLRQIRIRLLIQ